jgi:hypothetical protein
MAKQLTSALSFLTLGAAVEYNETRSRQFAHLAGAVYCEHNTPTWDCGYKCLSGASNIEICQGASTQAFIAEWEGACVVSFEGTHDISSALTDLSLVKSGVTWDQCEGCHVHSGFLSEWKSLQPCVLSSLNSHHCGTSERPAHVTGHSLGAAVAGVAMYSMESYGYSVGESYNFGMPRTGDEVWAQAFNARFEGRFFRVTHHRDPVVQVPPDTLIVNWHYTHVEPEVFYDGHVSNGWVLCSTADDETCSGQYWNLPIDLLNLCDHLSYMDIDSSPRGCASFESGVIGLPICPAITPNSDNIVV